MDVQWPWLDTLRVSCLCEEDGDNDKEMDQRIESVCENVCWGQGQAQGSVLQINYVRFTFAGSVAQQIPSQGCCTVCLMSLFSNRVLGWTKRRKKQGWMHFTWEEGHPKAYSCILIHIYSAQTGQVQWRLRRNELKWNISNLTGTQDDTRTTCSQSKRCLSLRSHLNVLNLTCI